MKINTVILFLLISQVAFSQITGDWYSFRTAGFTKIRISEDYILSSKKADTLIPRDTDYAFDSLQILDSYQKHNNYYYKVKAVLGDTILQKLRYDLNCSCLQTGFIDFKSKSSLSESLNAIADTDSSEVYLIKFYRKETIEQFYKLKDLSSSSKDQFVKILSVLLEKQETIRKIYKEKGQSLGFGILPLIMGNIQADALVANAFAPVFNKSKFNALVKKYGDDKEVAELLNKMEIRN